MKFNLKIILLTALCLCCLLSKDTQASWGEQRAVYTSASFLARGGAMTADVADYNAIFVNPAGIASIKEPILNFETQLEGSNKSNDNMTAMFGYGNDWHAMNQADIEALRNQDTRTKAGFLAAYIRQNFAFAMISTGALDMAYDDQTVPNVHSFVVGDVDMQMSVAKGFMENDKLKIGGTAKILYRTARTGFFTYDELATNGVKLSGPRADEGIAFSFDVGTQYTWFQEGYDVSVGLSALDLATPYGITTKFLGSTTEQRPPIMPARIAAGTGVKIHNIFSNVQMSTNLDIVKSLTESETSVLDLIHGGVEFKLPMYLAMSAGINQGYWTTGMSVTYWVFQASFATYAENTAIYDKSLGRMKSNRRYLFQFSFYL